MNPSTEAHSQNDGNGGSTSLLSVVQQALQTDDSASAKRLCEQHLQTFPDDPDAYRYLAQVHLLAGEHEQAIAVGVKATELAPTDPRAWSDLGRLHALLGAPERAIPCFEQAIGINPRHADSWHNLGLACKQRGQIQRAFDALKQALLLDPTRAESYLSLGNLLVDAEQLEDAIGCFERAAAHDPTLAKAHSRLAQELSQLGDVERAGTLFRHALSLDADDVGSWFGLGRTLEDLGQADAALSCYRNVLQRQPGHALALGQYFALAKEDEGQEWLAQLEPALDRTDGSAEAKALMGYGLAKWYDRRGRFCEAASAGTRANAARRKAAGPMDHGALTARIDAIIETYTAEFFTTRRHIGIGTDQPVFIVGLPRSGTTLTEQILSAHPLLHGAGELPDLARLAGKSLDQHKARPWQAAEYLVDEMTGHRVAHDYLMALRHGAPPDCRRISDKQPLNFFHLAFAALLFPNARVIHCRRDARDNALSIWMENFNPDQQYATDFSDLAHFIAQYRRLMAHWQAVLPLQILDMPYEVTVADVEGQARRMMTFLKVPWDAQCLDFHQQERAVQTPSRWQVRQPIYNRSVGRWKAYAPYLPELEAALKNL